MQDDNPNPQEPTQGSQPAGPQPEQNFEPNATRSGKRKKWWIVIGVVVVLLAIAVIALLAKNNKTSTSNSQTANSNSTAPKSNTSAGEPQSPCGTSSYACVPGVTIDRDIMPQLQKLGFTCAPHAPEGIVQACKGAKGDAVLNISFLTNDNDATDMKVRDVQIDDNVAANGTNPPDRTQDAWNANTDNFRSIVGIIFAAYPTVQKDLNNWVAKQTGACPFPKITDHDTVDGYEVRCTQVSRLSVNGSAGTVTTWSSNINLSTPFAD